ncbi:hypothetical protein WH47_07015, partial [Habropoda laboriosa]
GPICWPAHSSDINALDFYLWRYLLSIVYATPVGSIDNLKDNHTLIEATHRNLLERAELCVAEDGVQFEHLHSVHVFINVCI